MKPKPATSANALSEMAHELGLLERELAPMQPKISRVEQLRKAIRTLCEEYPADQPVTVDGPRFVLAVGPRGMQQTVNCVKLLRLVKGKVLASLISCTLKALENVDPAVRAQVIESHQTGPRSLKVFEKGLPA